MHVAVIFAMLVVVGTALIQRSSTKEESISTNNSYSNTTTVVTSEPTPSSTPNPTLAPSTTPTPSKIPSTPTPGTKNSPEVSNSWIYPGSKQIGQNTYTSTDSADTITNWYEAKIKSENLQINNFVKTSANSKIKNVLSAVSRSKKITVQITSDPESSNREILLNTDGF